jgi:L-fuconolactonase
MIDTHVHFWNYHPIKDAWITDEMKLIQRDFTPAELEHELTANGITGCIAVQADQSEQETAFLLNYARSYPFIKGIVGWIDLCKEDLPERLEEWATHKKIKGWRHIAQAEKKGFLISPAFFRGIAALKKYEYTYDILIDRNQLDDAINLVNTFPEQRFILDHIAKPDIKNKQDNEKWENGISVLSQYPNVYCKVSGMVTEADWYAWSYHDMAYYLDVVFKNFGTDRLMFGSDWPVCTVAANYRRTKQIIDQYTDQLTDNEKRAVFETNAIKCYQL